VNAPLPHAPSGQDTVPAPKTADCLVYNGEGVIATEGGTTVTYCEQCEGLGRVAQAVVNEWRGTYPLSIDVRRPAGLTIPASGSLEPKGGAFAIGPQVD
jgi:hypothetical protein